MIKIRQKIEKVNQSIPAFKMEPLQIATIVGSGEIVFRTASKENFELMSLSDSGAGHCWSITASFPVRLIQGSILVEISNEVLK